MTHLKKKRDGEIPSIVWSMLFVGGVGIFALIKYYNLTSASMQPISMLSFALNFVGEFSALTTITAGAVLAIIGWAAGLIRNMFE